MDVALYVTGAAVLGAGVGALLLRHRRGAVTDGGSADADDVAAAVPAAPRPVVVVDTRTSPDAPAALASVPAATEEPPALAGLRLIRESQLVPEQREDLAAQLRKLVMPPVGLARLVSDDVMSAASARELGELVLAEPRLAGRVLARANSAFYGLQSPIKSIPHAITYLGVPTVRSMALALLLADALPAGDPVLRRYSERTWDTAMLAAELCVLLGPRVGSNDAGVLCTHAILAFLGELGLPAVAGSQPDLAGRFSLLQRLEAEQQRLGVSSVLVGTILMQEWGLPAPIIREVEAVGRLVVTPPDTRDAPRAVQRGLVYACCRLAEAIVRGNVDHPGQLAVSPAAVPELHHLQAYLQLPGLARLPAALKAPEVAVVLGRFIAAARATTVTMPAPAAPAVRTPGVVA